MKGLLFLMPFLAVVSGMRLSPMVNNMALSKTIEIHGLTKEVLYESLPPFLSYVLYHLLYYSLYIL